MKTRKGRSRQLSDKAPLTFQDVAACFTSEEWKLLQTWQKELYRNVMKEIQQVLISLGPAIASSVFSLRATENEDLCHTDDQEFSRTHGKTYSPRTAVSNVDVFNTSRVENQHPADPQCRDRRDSTDRLAEGFDSVSSDDILRLEQASDAGWTNPHFCKQFKGTTSPTPGNCRTMPSGIKEERPICHMPYQDRKETQKQNINFPTAFPSVAFESEVGFMDHINEEGREESICVHSEFPSPDSCSGIKEQQRAILMDSAGSEEDERNAGPNPVVSFVIKEEEDSTCIMDHQHIEKRDDSSTQADDESMNRERAMRYSATYTEKTECSSLPANTSVKQAHSTNHQWPENNTELGREKTIHCGRGSISTVNANVHQGTLQGKSADSYNICESNKRKEIVHVFEPNIQSNSWQQHSCYEAEKTFTMKRTRTVKRLYNNSECEKTLSWKESLIEHKTSHMGAKMYPCLKCEKSFRQKETLVEHQRTHTGQRPYLCTDCGKNFIRKRTLIAHQRTHTGERPYQCSGCGKSFILKHHLNTHLRTCRHVV